MKMLQLFFIATVLLLSLYACQKKTVASAVSAPTLERPILSLTNTSKDVAILIPSQALNERAGIPGVYVLQNQQARFRLVRVGKISATQVQILSGLRGDESLVLGDLSTVHDGSPISVKQ